MAWPWKDAPNHLKKDVQAENHFDFSELDRVCWLLWLDEGGMGISKLFLTVHPEATTPHYSDQVTEGKAYRLRIGQFLARYSTLGDALSPDPCPRWQTGHTRAANMSFSARWVQRPENMTKLYILPRDLDQDENNTTHCANATFINPGANRWE